MAGIDFSQFSMYSHCPLKWWERYGEGLQQAQHGQQEGALTLGSLVHEGLRFYRQTGQVGIPPEALALLNPTPAGAGWAHTLLAGYVRRYPAEDFPISACEQLLTFPLGLINHPKEEGMAKVDYYFYLQEPTEVEDGQGSPFTLEAGWWIKEYKTRTAEMARGNWIAGWRMGKQADFQILALSHFLKTQGHPNPVVQGLLVDVLEKPRMYTPVRTCKGCEQRVEWELWIPFQDAYKCPLCLHVQALKPLGPQKERNPEYFRLRVTRSKAELEWSLDEIQQVAKDMRKMREGKRATLRADGRCVHPIYGPCEFLESHSAGRFAQAGQDGWVKVDDPFAYLHR